MPGEHKQDWAVYCQGGEEILGYLFGTTAEEAPGRACEQFGNVPMLLVPAPADAAGTRRPIYLELAKPEEGGMAEPFTGKAVVADLREETLPLLALAMAPELYSKVHGAECTVIACGDPGRFATGMEGVRVRFKDRTLIYQGGRPEGTFYLRHFADRVVAIAHANRVAARPLGLIRHRAGALTTSRGDFQLHPVQFADAGKAPRVPDEVFTELAAAVAGLIPRALDSEGNPIPEV
jgi:hypothetical protein